jgi:cobalt-precorrin 5A hydrolase
MVMGETMIVAGIGCRKGVSVADVIAAVEAALETHGLDMGALSSLATTAFKREEEAIFAAGRELGLPVMVVEDGVQSSPPMAEDHRFTPPHPASASLGHPLPGGERKSETSRLMKMHCAEPAQHQQSPSCHPDEMAAGIGGSPLLPNGEKVAAKRPDEGAVQTLTHSQLSQALAGVPSVSEAAALAAAGEGARLLGPRIVVGPATCALAISGGAA